MEFSYFLFLTILMYTLTDKTKACTGKMRKNLQVQLTLTTNSTGK